MLVLLALLLAQPVDTLDLGALRAAAEARDPRGVEPALLARAAQLRIEAIRREAFPAVALSGQATLQNEAPRIPAAISGGAIPGPPLEQVRGQVEVEWSVLDGDRRRLRTAVEEARFAEQTASAAVALYGLREAATEAFYGALLADARAATLRLAVDDLEARLRILRRQAAEGTALAATADAVEAEGLRLRQEVLAAEAEGAVARALLADLAGVPVGLDAVLGLPDLDAAVEGARQRAEVLADDDLVDALEAAGGRPELARFAAQARRARTEGQLARAATRPALGVFGQAGVGRPSPFDLFSEDVGAFAIVGARVRWAPIDHGRSRREAEIANLQAEIARAEADAFARRVRREARTEALQIDRLEATLALDDRAVALRESALRVARRQLDEGVLLPDVYTDRLTDLAAARLARERHRIERSLAQARLLSMLGLFPDRPLDP